MLKATTKPFSEVINVETVGESIVVTLAVDGRYFTTPMLRPDFENVSREATMPDHTTDKVNALLDAGLRGYELTNEQVCRQYLLVSLLDNPSTTFGRFRAKWLSDKALLDPYAGKYDRYLGEKLVVIVWREVFAKLIEA